MKLLDDFHPEPDARYQWTSLPVKEKWEPLLQQAVRVYNQLERETVKHGLRQCTTLHVSPHRLYEARDAFKKQGMHFVIIQGVGEYSGFAHAHPPIIPGRNWNYYGAISTNPESAHKFEYYSNYELNHDELGKLLGYPDCCREFFFREWGSGYVDPVWQQANNCDKSMIKKKSDYHIRLRDTTPWESNVMLRYIGLRIAPHIPCSLDCPHTHRIATEWLDLARELKMPGTDALIEFLQMPVEWDCLKGTAYISTPLFKIETNSMTCYPKYVVQREGKFYPEEAPNGLKFPWTEGLKFGKLKTKC